MITGFLEFLAEPWKMIYTNRNMLIGVYWSDLKARYASGNILGWLWIVLYPFLFLGTYSVLYIGLMSVRSGESSLDLIFQIFVGFVVWWALSEVIANGVGLVHSNVSLIRNTMFPVEMLAIRITVVSMTQMLICFALILIAYVLTGTIHLSWFAIIPLVFIELLLAIGIGWILATLGVFFKDLIQFTNIFLMIMLMLTPIGYLEEMATGRLKILVALNPVTYLIRAFRQCFSLGQWPDFHLFLILLVIAIVLFYFGYYIFSRLKAIFPDFI